MLRIPRSEIGTIQFDQLAAKHLQMVNCVDIVDASVSSSRQRVVHSLDHLLGAEAVGEDGVVEGGDFQRHWKHNVFC